MSGAQVPQVRSFNRTVSQIIGALNERYLGRDRPLGEARVLFEIGRRGADVRELRARLGLDSGYLSRILRALERDGLVVAARADKDRRVRRVRLTRAGFAELRELDRRSDRLAESMLEPLSNGQKDRLVQAMTEVERLLKASTATIEVEPPDSNDAKECLESYFKEINARFESGFDVRRALPTPAEEMTPPRGAFLVMRIAERPVGCGALVRSGPDVAYLKRMWIASSARGFGLGRRLLLALEDRARAFGLTTVRLETNKALAEAQALYRREGYEEVQPFNNEPYAHHWFEKRLV
jgi:DNA-binding MarR family transcriptional regulator/GNAT superfamily N-acetyltransferase